MNSELETYRYLSHWYTVAIREMAALPGFKLQANWIQKRLRSKVGLPEIEESIKILLDHGFLRVDANGKVGITGDKHLDCLGGLYKLVLAKFHTQMFGLAKEVFENSTRKERAILGHTFAVAPEKMEQVRAILNQAVDQIKNLSDSDHHRSEIYQIEFACFPLTQPIKDETNEKDEEDAA